jgi:hypothetical protein
MNAEAIDIASWAERALTLENATGELDSLALSTESEIRTVARIFERVAGHTNTILRLAAAIVGCVDKENISSVLPKIRTLGAAARHFIEDRLQATTGILDTVTTAAKLLRS